MTSKTLRVVLTALTFGLAAPAFAAGGGSAPAAQNWSFNGPFGTFDRGELQRGYQVYKEVCASCHAMKYVAFRNLRDIGFSEAEVKALAATFEVTDGPNDDGEMFQRPALPSDKFPSPFPNEKAARAANGGAYPPDLSLIAKARMHGPDYLYALLTGYKDAPNGFTVGEGLHYNEAFPGHQIAMPKPLNEDQVTYADGTKATVEQMSRDVSAFLMWAAEPKLEERKRMGLKVMIFLVILTGLFFAAKKRIWRDVH
ncbi:cytochrome c1 [uncultured Ferrovibrio sp.]|jgi:ubiquinol-cytochrome c reductase cytochrome c1 subunit|uniref:cytochrome c1 n=1 Tax=uncultured Ferrovibrio sp. TaxID=1576913 RepID=UPI0026241910|nr:cytochrome c1 [uncultured Ferrovibrio sp.]